MGDLDDYLDGLDGPARAAFDHIRGLAVAAAPEATQGTSYGMAALKYHGKPLLGFRAAQGHLSLFPFSAEVVEAVADRLAGFELSKGTIRFTVDRPLPDDVVGEVVLLRVQQIAGTGGSS